VLMVIVLITLQVGNQDDLHIQTTKRYLTIKCFLNQLYALDKFYWVG